MEKKHYPGFIYELNKDQERALAMADTFRGEYISAMVQVEMCINKCIISFFDGYNKEKTKILSFMYHFLLFNERFPLKLKCDSIKHIMGIELHDLRPNEMSKAHDLWNILDRLIQLRNTVAHYPFSPSVTNLFGYDKPKAKFLFNENNSETAGAWTMDSKTVVLNENILDIIGLQMADVRIFLDDLSDLMGTNTGDKDYTAYLFKISEFLKSKNEKYLKNEGIMEVMK